MSGDRGTATWRARELLIEARRNSGSRLLTMAGTSTAVLVAVGLLVSAQAASALTQEIGRRDAGSLVWMATADPERPLETTLCARLAGVSGVAAVGGVAATRPRPAHLYAGGAPITIESVMPDTSRVWDPDAVPGAVLVGRDLLRTGAVAVGSTLWMDDGTSVEVTAAASTRIPVARLQSGVILPSASLAPLAECWVRFEPGAIDAGEAVLNTAFAETNAQVAPYSRPTAGLKTPKEQWNSFAATQPGIVGGVLLGAIFVLMTWTRRSEFAVYRAFGTSLAQVSLMVAFETVAVLAIATPAAALATVQISGWTSGAMPGEAYAATLLAVISSAAAALAIGTAFAPMATRGNVLGHLKDR